MTSVSLTMRLPLQPDPRMLRLPLQIGRDLDPKFSRFKSSSESASSRYIRTACDVLGPRGDEKNGCREHWIAYCNEVLNKKSAITSFRMNRFNNFFEGAAALIYHRENISQFFSSYKDNLNLKLQSVLLDCLSPEVQALVRALGVISFRVTKPFWELLHSEVNYADLHIYIQRMHQNFKIWSEDASQMLIRECKGIFGDLGFSNHQEDDAIYLALLEISSDNDLVVRALQQLMSAFILVTERQLCDFLPGGPFGESMDSALKEKMSHCHLTNLVGENEFGDLDFSQFRRRHASIHFHSSVQMIKRNKTVSTWLASKPESEQIRLLSMARSQAKKLRQKHMHAEKEIRKRNRERMEEAQRKIKEKEAQKLEQKRVILEAVKSHGGPFLKQAEVRKALRKLTYENAKLELVKNEIRYLKQVLGVKNGKLFFGKKSSRELANDLCDFLKFSCDDLLSSLDLQHKEKDEPSSESENEIHLVKDKTNGVKCGKKRKSTFTEEKCPPKKRRATETKDFSFKFTSQGMWVAVAYENYDKPFIGEVVEVKSPTCATVQYLSRGYSDTFRWPRVEDIADTDAKYVVASGFEVLSNNSGRSWNVIDLNEIDDLHKEYVSVYFECEEV